MSTTERTIIPAGGDAAPARPAKPRLSATDKRALAADLVNSRTTLAEAAERHGYTLAGMRALTTRDTFVREYLEPAEATHAAYAARAVAKLAVATEAAVDGIIRTARGDDDDKLTFDARRDILDRAGVRPPKDPEAATNIEVNVHQTAQVTNVLSSITQSVDKFRKTFGGTGTLEYDFTDHLAHGAEGLEMPAPSAAAQAIAKQAAEDLGVEGTASGEASSPQSEPPHTDSTILENDPQGGPGEPRTEGAESPEGGGS